MNVSLLRRYAGDVVIVDVTGRLCAGEAADGVREEIRALAAGGHKKILLNLAGTSFMDSSGIGQLVSGHTTLINQGGQMKLSNLTPRGKMLLEITRLFIALEVHEDEASALAAFG